MNIADTRDPQMIGSQACIDVRGELLDCEYAIHAPQQKQSAERRVCPATTARHLRSAVVAGVRYVVDTGRSKQRVLEGRAGLAKFEVRWISQAGAAQRAGRAGRTGPGHCYRFVCERRPQPALSDQSCGMSPLDASLVPFPFVLFEHAVSSHACLQ